MVFTIAISLQKIKVAIDFYLNIAYTTHSTRYYYPMYIPPELDQVRLDIALSTLLDISRSQAKKMIDADRVRINQALPKKQGDIVHANDLIEISEALPDLIASQDKTPTEDTSQVPTIVTETSDYIVINKPAGLLTHPTEAGESWSVSHWVWQHYPALRSVGEYPNRPGIVHRLDKETSGLMVIAKTQAMFISLKEQFKTRAIEKEYTALVHGIIDRDTDSIDFDIDRGRDGRMVARPKRDPLKLKNVGKEQPGKSAKTEFFVLDRFSRYTLLNVHIYTGRTHQIRVHLFAYNHPVVGDTLYTHKKINHTLDQSLGRLFLHAAVLAFTDQQGERIRCTAELPTDLATILETLA